MIVEVSHGGSSSCPHAYLRILEAPYRCAVKYGLVVAIVVGLVALCALGASLAAVESSHGQLSITSAMRAAAKSSCQAELSTRVLVGTPMTASQARAWPPPTHALTGHAFSHPNAFPGLSGTQIVAWCWMHGLDGSDPSVAYLVAPGYRPLKVDARHSLVPASTTQGVSRQAKSGADRHAVSPVPAGAVADLAQPRVLPLGHPPTALLRAPYPTPPRKSRHARNAGRGRSAGLLVAGHLGIP